MFFTVKDEVIQAKAEELIIAELSADYRGMSIRLAPAAAYTKEIVKEAITSQRVERAIDRFLNEIIIEELIDTYINEKGLELINRRVDEPLITEIVKRINNMQLETK